MSRMRENSALKNVMLALVPYSRQNLLLSYSPNRFFNELEKSSGHNQKALKQAVRRAKNKGYLEETKKNFRLTELGKRVAEPFTASSLEGGRLMIIFDIPELKSSARQQLRSLLRQWKFRQIQKSVWVSDYDHVKSVKRAVKELELSGCVQLYECFLVFPRT